MNVDDHKWLGIPQLLTVYWEKFISTASQSRDWYSNAKIITRLVQERNNRITNQLLPNNNAYIVKFLHRGREEGGKNEEISISCWKDK